MKWESNICKKTPDIENKLMENKFNKHFSQMRCKTTQIKEEEPLK